MSQGFALTVALKSAKLILLVLTCNPKGCLSVYALPSLTGEFPLIAKVVLCFRVQAFCFAADIDCGVEVAVNFGVAVSTLIYAVT